MLPGHFYTADDFQQPAFCVNCALHTPKSVLNSLGGRCANCAGVSRNPIKKPFNPLILINLALIFLVAALGYIGFKQLLGNQPSRNSIGSPSNSGSTTAPPARSTVPSPDDSTPIDASTLDNLKNQAILTMNTAFGANTVNGWNLSSSEGFDGSRHAPIVTIGGQFPCVVDQVKVTVSWNLVYVRDPNGNWLQDRKAAWYPVPNGTAQFDWDTKQFVRPSR